MGTGILISADGTITNEVYELEHLKDTVIHITSAERNKWNDALLKTEQTLTDEELTQVRSNLKFIGKDVAGQTFIIDGTEVTASANAEIFGDYESNIAVGQWSIAEGSGTVAKGRASHAEGAMTQALADGTHTEGYQTKATGSCSHAEGLATTVSGAQSHAEGRYTIAASGAQHVEGIANIEDTENKYIHIAGNGTFDARSNAHTLDWDGNAWFSGDVYVGSTSGINKDEGSKKLLTEEDLYGFMETLDAGFLKFITITGGTQEMVESRYNDVTVIKIVGATLSHSFEEIAAMDSMGLMPVIGVNDMWLMPSVMNALLLSTYGADANKAHVFYSMQRLGALDTAPYTEVHILDNGEIYMYIEFSSIATKTEVNDKIAEHITADAAILADTVTGEKYKIQIQNGQLITVLMEEE